jgi:hypothetical protein
MYSEQHRPITIYANGYQTSWHAQKVVREKEKVMLINMMGMLF